MDIKYSNYNRPNDKVRQLQFQLNSINDAHGLHWEHLKDDGIYGKRTAGIIKKFVNWNRQMSLATDGMGLPILTDALFTEVQKAYNNRPVASMSQPVLKSFVPNATPANPAEYKEYERMLEAHPTLVYDARTTIIPEPFHTLCNGVKGAIEGLINELKLVRELKNWDLHQIIKWYSDKASPKIKTIKNNFDNMMRSAEQYRTTHVSNFIGNKQLYDKSVTSAYTIGERFEKWLKEANIGQRVDKFMKGKGGDIVKGVAKPVKKFWDLKDLIGDLCILAYLLITGEPVDNLWWSRFETNLYKFVDGMIGILLGELLVLGLVAVGVLAGPATLVAGIIGVAVAIIFGLVCDGFDFSPTKFFMELIGKSILSKMGQLVIAVVDNHAKVLGIKADGKEMKITRPILYR